MTTLKHVQVSLPHPTDTALTAPQAWSAAERQSPRNLTHTETAQWVNQGGPQTDEELGKQKLLKLQKRQNI